MSRLKLLMASLFTGLALTGCASLDQSADRLAARLAEPGRCVNEALPEGGVSVACTVWKQTTTTTTTTTTSPAGETATTVARTTTGDR